MRSAAWYLIIFLYGFQSLLRQSADIFEGIICNALHINNMQYIILYISSYTAGYAIIQIPIGMIFDRLNVIHVMRYTMSIFAVAILIYSIHIYYFNIYIGTLARIITGMMAGSLYNAGIKIANIEANGNDKILSHYISQLITFGILSTMIGERILYYFAQYNIHMTFQIFCLIGAVIALILSMQCKKPFAQYTTTNVQYQIISGIKRLIVDKVFLAIIVLAGILYSSLLFSGSLAVTTIKHINNIDESNILLFKSFSSVGILIGLRLWIFITQYISAKRALMICALIQCTALLSLTSNISNNYYILMFIFLLLGTCVGATAIVVPLYINKFSDIKSLAVSIHNMSSWIFMSIITTSIATVSVCNNKYILFSPFILFSILCVILSVFLVRKND